MAAEGTEEEAGLEREPAAASASPAAAGTPAATPGRRSRPGVPDATYLFGWTMISEFLSGSRTQNIGGTGPP